MGFAGGGGGSAGAATGAGAAAPSAANTTSPAAGAASSTPRTVQETDLYRFDATTNRLYYLNSYRGLMVFDLTDVDHPKLLGRSPIFGSPVQMFVQDSVAVVVVADWYGTLDSGQPFHGSIVRGLDATDPTNIKVLGEAKLGGWVQDTRIVGNVLYAVSEDYGWTYGWGNYGGGIAGAPGSASSNGPDVIVSSVNFTGGVITAADSKTYAGYGGVFNVTANSILLAHPTPTPSANYPIDSTTTDLRYLDISDPAGAIVEHQSVTVAGDIQGWGTDNGRWNLDFADGKTAHVLGCSSAGCGAGYVLSTADFSNPDMPIVDSQFPINSSGWTAAARFDGQRMYLSPGSGYFYSGSGNTTPLQIYDLSNPAAPALAGQTSIPGNPWLILPSGNQLFALGQNTTNDSSQVSLNYLDVTDATKPTLIGTSSFGDGWAWTPAAETFKAFIRGNTLDGSQGLVVLPFSGWSSSSQQYNNGVQLIEYTPTSITTAGAARGKGWVERGIFANGRIISLSDLALSVVNYADPLAPSVTAQLTLARNVVASQPTGSTIAEISASDWWGNDVSQSDVRVLPTSDAAEVLDESTAPDVAVPGVDAQVFTNGNFVYVVSAVQLPVPCPVYAGQQPVNAGPCTGWQEQVQIIDISNGGATARGLVKLPIDPGYFWYWGWYGCYSYDWYDGSDIVQVQGDALAFRRWHPNYGANGIYVDASDDLFIADLSNPDAPTIGSAVITQDLDAWWGDMKVVGGALYTTHYAWPFGPPSGQNPTVKYYLDKIDISDRAHPKVAASINVPGVLVGGSDTDSSILYTIDYQWDVVSGNAVNSFDVLEVDANSVAHIQSTTALDGWVGNVIVRGNTAYTSTQLYAYSGTGPTMELHQLDLSQPTQPVDRTTSGAQGWGWLLDVQGDRALVLSGWGSEGMDIYRVSPDAPPTYDQFVRTEGWGVSSVARQDNTLFLSSGDWGVQSVQLQ
jgi:hypothetical protein